MKKQYKFLIIIVLFAFAKVTHAQNYQWDWANHGGGTMSHSSQSNSYNDYERVLDIAIDTNNNYYYLMTFANGNPDYNGNSLLFNDIYDIYLLSTTCDGTFRWDKEIGSSSVDFGYSLNVDSSNNVYVTGQLRGLTSGVDPYWDTDFNLNSTLGRNDVGPHNRTSYLVKYNQAGNFQWIKFPDNGMLTGNEVLPGFLSRQAVVEPNGTSHWLVSIGPGTHVDGNVTVPNTVDREWKIIRYDTNGTYVGHTDIDYTGDFNDFNFNFAYDPLLNRYYFSNIKTSSSSDLIYRGNTLAGNAFIVAIDGVTGNDVWIHDASNALGMEIHDIKVDDSSNVYFTGRSQTSNGVTSMFAGYSFTQQSNGGGAQGTFAIALDATGNLLWGSNSDTFSRGALALSVNATEVAVATNMDATDTWDGITSQYGVNLGEDPAVVRLNKATGTAISINQIEGTAGQRDELTAIATDNFGNYVVGGYMRNSLFLNNPNVPTITKNGGDADFFIARLAKTDCNGVLLSNEDVEKSITSISPNPATDFVQINSEQEFSSFSIYNVSGQQVLAKKLNTNQRLDISSLSNGMYFLKLENDGQEIETLKLVKK